MKCLLATFRRPHPEGNAATAVGCKELVRTKLNDMPLSILVRVGSAPIGAARAGCPIQPQRQSLRRGVCQWEDNSVGTDRGCPPNGRRPGVDHFRVHGTAFAIRASLIVTHYELIALAGTDDLI